MHVGKGESLPSVIGNVPMSEYQGTPTPYSIKNGKVVTMVAGKQVGPSFSLAQVPPAASQLETDQRSAGVDSKSPGLKANPDGSYTVWFAPTAPTGKEGNWVQTMPEKSWSALLRLYGPLEPWFDKSWKPGDFELVDG